MAIKTGQEMVAEAKTRISEVTAKEVLTRLSKSEAIVLLDVREANEWNLGRLPNAIHIARGQLETNVEARIPRDATVVIYCATGNRSVFAADTMQQMGYENVASMSGGFRDWVGLGGDVAD